MKIAKNTSRIIGIFLILVTFTRCAQIKEMVNFLSCDFRISSVTNINMAGINVQSIKSFADLSIMDGAKLLSAVTSGTLPLNLTVNVEARNPNTQKASLSKLDWILLIDDLQMAQGTTIQRIEIQPNNGTATFPVQITSDLVKVLSGQSAKNIINFGLNLAGYGTSSSRIALRAKPSIMIGNSTIEYPGYITIKKDFTSK